MNEFEDYYYGYMVPSAGYLKYFALYLYDEGFVIQMPTMESPRTLEPFVPQSKLFHVLKESTGWGDMLGIETVGALNDKITKSDMREVVLVQEAMQEKRIAEIAGMIAKKAGKKNCIDRWPILFRKDNIFTPAVYSASGNRHDAPSHCSR